MKKIILFFLFVFFLCGCENSKKNKSEENFDFIPSNRVTRLEKITFDDNRFIDSCTFVALESSLKALIGYISQMTVYNNRYYILDGQRMQLKVFDSAGNFLLNIGSKGNGAEEYLSIGAFVINEKDNKICLFDPACSSVHEYRLDGHFIKSTKYEDGRLDAIKDATWEGDYIYCFLNQTFFNSVMCFKISDKDYSVNDEWGEYPVKSDKQEGYSIAKHPFSCYKGELHCISLYSDTIFSYKNGELSPCLLIETGKPNIPSDYFKGKPFEFEPQKAYYHMLAVQSYSPGFSVLYETGRYILTYFFLKNEYYLIDKNTKDVFYVENSMFPEFGSVDCVSGDKLVEIFTQDNIEYYKSKIASDTFKCPQNLKNILDKYDLDNDNPILVVYHMKK